MADINTIAVAYRQYLARLPKHNTRTDYSKRLAMLEKWCSMYGITRVEEIDFLQFLDWVFYDRGVSPRTRNNYRTWLRSFCSWLRIEPNPMDAIKPMKEPGKIRQPLSASVLRRIKEHLTAKDKHFLLAVMLEYYTFIRPGELSELRIGDIDVKRHAIHVRASISKNGKTEMVGLNTAIVSLMRELGIEEICKLHSVYFIPSYNGLGFARLNASNAFNVDNIHQSNLGGYNFARAIWSRLKNIPLFYAAIPS